MAINENEKGKKEGYEKKRNGKKGDGKKGDEKNVIEGLTNPAGASGAPLKISSDSAWDFEAKLKDNIEQMLPELKQFALWTVVNILIVWVIWKFGSHVIWYNSIPRVLLKVIYPPGYEYLKDILEENKDNPICVDVTHNGGMVKETVTYDPDQIALFKQRKSCCPGLEQPYAPGSEMDVPCFPLSTNRDTINKLNQQNDTYKVWNSEFKGCISYIKWQADTKEEVMQAKASAAEAELQLKQAQLAEKKASRVAQQQQQKQEDAQKGGMRLFGRKNPAQANATSGDVVADTALAGEAQGLAEAAQSTSVQAATAAQQQAQQAAEAVNTQQALTQQAQQAAAATADANSLAAVVAPRGSSSPEGNSALQEIGALGMGEGAGSNVRVIGEQATSEGTAEVEGEGKMLASVVDGVATGKEKVGEAAEVMAAATAQALKEDKAATKLDLRRAKMDEKLDENRATKIAKKEIFITKRKNDIETKKAKAMEKIAEKMKAQSGKVKFELEKKEQALKAKQERLEARLEQSDLKFKNAQDMQEKEKAQKERIALLEEKEKLNEVKEEGDDKVSLEGAKQGIAAAGKAIEAAFNWLVTSIPKLFIGFFRWTAGCSFDQGIKGWVFGPNTANSLFASYTLAVQSSISWVIYNCLSAAGGNIVMAFLMGTVLLILGMAIIQLAWVSPLSTIWTLVEFKWPQPMMIISILASPILFAIYAILFGVLCIGYMIMFVLKFWFSCLFSSKGKKFKSQLAGCSNVQASLRRLFMLLTFINAYYFLPTEVITGMVLCFLYIEYKQMKK